MRELKRAIIIVEKKRLARVVGVISGTFVVTPPLYFSASFASIA